MGNYDLRMIPKFKFLRYTTTRENGELRRIALEGAEYVGYTTTRENGELRPRSLSGLLSGGYTTTRENGELRPILTGGD